MVVLQLLQVVPATAVAATMVVPAKAAAAAMMVLPCSSSRQQILPPSANGTAAVAWHQQQGVAAATGGAACSSSCWQRCCLVVTASEQPGGDSKRAAEAANASAATRSMMLPQPADPWQVKFHFGFLTHLTNKLVQVDKFSAIPMSQPNLVQLEPVPFPPLINAGGSFVSKRVMVGKSKFLQVKQERCRWKEWPLELPVANWSLNREILRLQTPK